MSKLLPLEGYLKNLKQEIPPSIRRLYMSKEQAYEMLKEYTGKDFGYDIEEWEKYTKGNF
ncbi:MAG: hypothetical protein Q8942_05775 [Bacillota bacterium]|nr:hypothetical protein [Bacillota bacterium]